MRTSTTNILTLLLAGAGGTLFFLYGTESGRKLRGSLEDASVDRLHKASVSIQERLHGVERQLFTLQHDVKVRLDEVARKMGTATDPTSEMLLDGVEMNTPDIQQQLPGLPKT
jgi:hypothetical protein